MEIRKEYRLLIVAACIGAYVFVIPNAALGIVLAAVLGKILKGFVDIAPYALWAVFLIKIIKRELLSR